MPRRDGTGPMGEGSKTGRGLGICNTAEMPTNTSANGISNFGDGFGSGKGCRRGGKGCQQGRRKGQQGI